MLLNKSWLVFFSLLIILISFDTYSANGLLLQTFNNPTPDPEDRFGQSVSISENYVLVGAHRDDTGAQDAGSAYLFDTSGNLLQTFNNPTPELEDRFGIRVSISENYVLVGAHHDNTGVQSAGSAYLFTTSGNLLQTINNPTPERYDRFGHSVSISENYIVVGAPWDDTGAEDAGSAYLFDTSGNLLQTFNNPTPELKEEFGESVSISGNYIVVGANHDNTGAQSAGSAYLFDTSGNLLQTINNPTPERADLFGKFVSISGNYVLVGADADDTGAKDAGSAYLFDTSGNLLQTINNPTPEHDDQFGHSVLISGNYIVVGAHHDNTGAQSAGSAYLFDTSGNLLQTFNNPTPEPYDGIAHSVSISGNYVLVGAHEDDVGAENAGSAYLFTQISTSQVIDEKLLPIDTDSLFLVDVQASAAWLIPVVVSAVGIGLVFLRRK